MSGDLTLLWLGPATAIPISIAANLLTPYAAKLLGHRSRAIRRSLDGRRHRRVERVKWFAGHPEALVAYLVTRSMMLVFMAVLWMFGGIILLYVSSPIAPPPTTSAMKAGMTLIWIGLEAHIIWRLMKFGIIWRDISRRKGWPTRPLRKWSPDKTLKVNGETASAGTRGAETEAQNSP